MNEALVTNEEYEQAVGAKREYEIVPAGKYLAGILNSTVRVKLSKAGNRYLSISFGTREDEAGNEAFSKVIYKIVMFEGSYDVKQGPNAGQTRQHKAAFIKFAAAIGLDAEQTSSAYASLLENAPTAAELAELEPGQQFADVAIDIDGEVLDLKGQELNVSVDVEQYNGEDKNVIHGMWAV